MGIFRAIGHSFESSIDYALDLLAYDLGNLRYPLNTRCFIT